MPTYKEVSVSDRLTKVPPAVRSTVKAARNAVKAAAPKGTSEVPYRGGPPRSKNAMWKLVRYSMSGGDGYVVAIGAFADHASLFFPRGRELDDGAGILEGRGKQFRFITLRSPADVGRSYVKRMLLKAFRLASAT